MMITETQDIKKKRAIDRGIMGWCKNRRKKRKMPEKTIYIAFCVFYGFYYFFSYVKI